VAAALWFEIEVIECSPELDEEEQLIWLERR
jgi:hypothetical protein